MNSTVYKWAHAFQSFAGLTEFWITHSKKCTVIIKQEKEELLNFLITSVRLEQDKKLSFLYDKFQASK